MTRDLEADLKLCEAATEGPWTVFDSDDTMCMTYIGVCTDNKDPEGTDGYEHVIAATLLQEPRYADHHSKQWYENANFIAAARTGWPETIRELMEARKRIAELKTKLRESHQQIEDMEMAAWDRSR